MQMSEPDAWLSTSQAAAMLGVSERTVQRRCASGKLQARRITDESGERWEVLLSGGVPPRVTTGDAKGADRVTTQVPPTPERVPTGDDTQRAQNGGTVPTGDDRGAAIVTTGADSALVAELRAEVERGREREKFLQGVIENRDQTVATLTAALREAMKQRALPAPADTAAPLQSAPTFEPKVEAAPLAEMPQNAPESPPMVAETQLTPAAQQRSKDAPQRAVRVERPKVFQMVERLLGIR